MCVIGFSILDSIKDTCRGVSWNCDSWLASAVRIEATVKAYEDRIKVVELTTAKTAAAVVELDRRVEKVEAATTRWTPNSRT